MDNPQLQLSNQICFPLYSVSRLITKAYKPHLDKMNVTYTQYLVLMVLWENDGVTVNDISKKLLLNTNTLSPLLKRMEALKLLDRTRSVEDERKVIVKLTEKGKNLEIQAASIPSELIKVLAQENTDLTEVLQLKEMLNKLIAILSEDKK
jgi:DNA-binding MarR family transcriptional regulator